MTPSSPSDAIISIVCSVLLKLYVEPIIGLSIFTVLIEVFVSSVSMISDVIVIYGVGNGFPRWWSPNVYSTAVCTPVASVVAMIV